MDFAINVPRKDLIDFLLRLKDIDEDTKKKLLKMREGLMEERLQELKEKITSFVRDYNIESFDVWIDDDVNINNISKPKEERKEVRIEIRV